MAFVLGNVGAFSVINPTLLMDTEQFYTELNA